MIQLAIAAPAVTVPPRSEPAPLPNLAETLATITAAGRLMTELKAQLEAAGRRIAALEVDKHTLERQLSGLRSPHPLRSGIAETPAPTQGRSHVDDALDTIAQRLGPGIVRAP